MSITPEQLAANRANAQRSTGPTSDEGKATSSQNARTHGLTGKTVLLPDENKTEFELFCIEVADSLEPEGPIEREFARIVANDQWRLRRVKRIEDGLLARGTFGPTDPLNEPACFQDCDILAQSFMENRRSFNNLSQYERRIYCTMTNALKQIKDLQTARNKHHEDIVAKAHSLYAMWRFTDGFGQVPFGETPAAAAEPTPEPEAAEPVVAEPETAATESDATARVEMNGQALSSLDSDHRRDVVVSGFVFPKSPDTPETPENSSIHVVPSVKNGQACALAALSPQSPVDGLKPVVGEAA
jgi:hypothetical protein